MQQTAQNISAEDENGDRVTGEVLQIIEQLPDIYILALRDWSYDSRTHALFGKG